MTGRLSNQPETEVPEVDLNRRKKLLDGIDVARLSGLEIGALCNPVVPRHLGEIRYVDYADTAFLRKRYANDPAVDVDKIVDVDFIWGREGLEEITGGGKFDYIVASHVIEHVPDLVTWLKELRSVLKPGGTIRLAVPDRRYTFDILRAESRMSDVLAAFVQKARRPLPAALIDHVLNVAAVDATAAWNGTLETSRIRRQHGVADALNVARDSLENGTYHDVHCWVFTPRSFIELFEQMAALELVDFACDRFFDTSRYQIEFFASLGLAASHDEARRSWAAVKQELVPESDWRPAAPAASNPSVASGATGELVRLDQGRFARALRTRFWKRSDRPRSTDVAGTDE